MMISLKILSSSAKRCTMRSFSVVPSQSTGIQSPISDSAVASKISIVRHPYLLPSESIGKELGGPEIISPKKNVFSIIKLKGTQYKVTLDDVITVDRIEGADIGNDIEVPEVLLVGSLSATIIGRPLVEGASVIFSVEEVTKDKKVIAFKMRRRKNSKSLRGFRRDLTILRVKDITLTDPTLWNELLLDL